METCIRKKGLHNNTYIRENKGEKLIIDCMLVNSFTDCECLGRAIGLSDLYLEIAKLGLKIKVEKMLSEFN